MTKTKKTVLWSVIGCLCVIAIAGTAIGVTYSQYRSSASSSGLVAIPKWDFDLTTSSDDSFYVDTTTELSPNQSVYTDGNTNRYSVSDPIAIAKITNKGEVSGDVSVSASLNQTNPYNPNNKYQANETFENEFLDHFSLIPCYSFDGDALVDLSKDSLITLYPESEVEEDDSLYNSVYIYVTVTWLSDIDGVNGDAFDTWVGRYIDSINLSISFTAYQHGDFTPTQANAKLGVQVSDYECLYFDGTIDESGHLNTTSNYEEAVELIIAEVKENEYTLGFYASGVSPTSYYASETLTYIGYSGSSTGGFTLTSDPYIWLYDDDYDVFYTYDSNGTQRFIGNQSGYDYLGCFAWSNIDNSSYNTGSSFESEPELEEAPSGPQEGDPTYKLGVKDTASYTYRYFNGKVSSSHLSTTTVYDEAVEVYITKLYEDDDYTYSLSFYDDDTLQYIATSGSNSANMKLQTSVYSWIWDDTNEYFYDPNDNNRYLGCQVGNDYFAAYAATNNYLHVIPYSEEPEEIPGPEIEEGDEDEEGLIGKFDFSTNTSTSGTATTASVIDTFYSGDPDLYVGCTECSAIYPGNSSSGAFQGSNFMKVGSSSVDGILGFKFVVGVDIDKVVVNAHSWTTGETNTLTVNGGDAQNMPTSGSFEDLTFDLDGNFTNTITLDCNHRGFIKSIKVYGTYTANLDPIESLTINADNTKLTIGDSLDVTVSWTPTNTAIDIDDLVWASTNESVASVVSSTTGATIHALAKGETQISATALNGVTGTLDISVTELDLNIGETVETTITYETVMGLPEFSDISWSTSSQTCFSSTDGVQTDFSGFTVTWYTGTEDGSSSNGCAIYQGSSLRIYKYAHFDIQSIEGYEIVSTKVHITSNGTSLDCSNGADQSYASAIWTTGGPDDGVNPIVYQTTGSNNPVIDYITVVAKRIS